MDSILIINHLLYISYFLTLVFAFGEDKDCAYILTDLKGTIRSPGFPNYKDGSKCTWLITVPKGMIIHLKTKTFSIESSYNCERDALYIYDGPGTNSKLYSKPYCDKNGPNKVESSGNTLFLKFITDLSINSSGFEIEYQAKKKCDYEFNGRKTGWFTSPKFPNHYYENANCSYRIKTHRDNAIRITFTDFLLENKVNGKCLDYVAVYDIITGIPRLIKEHCGIGIPPPITSTSNEVLVKFRSDSMLGNQGFNATFLTLNHICRPNEFKCNNGRCVSVDLICNNHNDCFDNSDENFCCSNRFKCRNNRCIRNDLVCNSRNDCGDWSDEKICDGSAAPTPQKTTITTTTKKQTTVAPKTTFYYPPCQYAEFTCDNLRCIDASLRCNGYDDCGDRSDEVCSGQCRNMNGQCQHICTDDKQKLTCSCYKGFNLDSDGKKCIDIDECSSRPCEERCINSYGSYKCACNKGYRLAENEVNCTDFDECRHYKGLCEQKCINTIGSYKCACFPGYVYHADKQSCVDVNECIIENGGCAEDCVNTIGSFRCQCNKPGYKMVPGKAYCEEINECELGTAACTQVCTNTDGSYQCSCRPGFRLDYDLHTCVDINECLLGVPGCWGNCINTLGSYKCYCDPGFRGILNDTKCEDINECEIRNGGCSNQCVNTKGSYFCKCPKGFVARDPNSYTCDDKDECLEKPCEGECLNTPGSFECRCGEGYKLMNRTKCVDMDECKEGKDVHGCSYMCFNTDGSYFCTCPEGFILDNDGKRCLKTANGTGCKRLKVDLREILLTKWTNVSDGWTWQVGISVDFPRILNIPRDKCMGILVDNQFVLTTAHCVRFGYIKINPSKLLLSIGGYSYGYQNSKENIRAKEIYFHPKVDVALIHLSKEISESSKIQPICLPKVEHVDTSIGEKLVTSAWPPRGYVKILQQVSTTIDTNTACQWQGKSIFRKDDSLCVRFSLPKKKLALPLSGAPLLGKLRGTSDTRRRQKWYLTGILIYGDGYPGNRDTISTKYKHVGYHKVTKFSDWIKRTIERTQNQ